MSSSSSSPAISSSSKGKAPLHDTHSKTTPPRYSTILPKLPLPIVPSLPTPFLPPPPPPPLKDLPEAPSQPEFYAYPTFIERKMHISSPALILLLILLFLESTVIFIYTTIGLIKNNSLTYLYAPIQPQYPLCQNNMQVNSGLRSGPNILNDAIVIEEPQMISTASIAPVSATVSTTLTTIMPHPTTLTPPSPPILHPLLSLAPSQSLSTVIVYASPPPADDAHEAISTTTITLFTSNPTPPTTTPNTNSIVTSIIYSTTVIEASRQESATSTVYITTTVPAAPAT